MKTEGLFFVITAIVYKVLPYCTRLNMVLARSRFFLRVLCFLSMKISIAIQVIPSLSGSVKPCCLQANSLTFALSYTTQFFT